MRYKKYWFSTSIMSRETLYKLEETNPNSEEFNILYAQGLLDKLKDLKECLKDISKDEIDGVYHSNGAKIYVCIKQPSGTRIDFTRLNACPFYYDFLYDEEWPLYYIKNKPASALCPLDIDEEIEKIEKEIYEEYGNERWFRP